MVYPLRRDKATETSARRTSISGARMVAAGFETMATKKDLDTYMKWYEELAHRVKRHEEAAGI